MKRALITGIAGQDGAYLLENGYGVHGIKRRASLFNIYRMDHFNHESPNLGNLDARRDWRHAMDFVARI